jgi:hypothetical protein
MRVEGGYMSGKTTVPGIFQRHQLRGLVELAHFQSFPKSYESLVELKRAVENTG